MENVKVKVINSYDFDGRKEATAVLNEFIKGKDVVDIKLNEFYWSPTNREFTTYLIIYKEDE